MARLRPALSTPTLSSLARDVGVDVSLVSRVLRGDPAARLSADKREQILASASAQGYRPNRVARSLRTGRTSILGMLTPDITNPFHSVLFRGVEQAAELAGYDTILGNTDDSQDRFRAVVAALAEGHVDGLLVATAFSDDKAIEWLRSIDLPYQLMNRRRASADDPWVGPDDFRTGWLGGEHLAALGHRRIAFMMADLAVWNHQRRLDGFRAVLAAHGIEPDEGLIATGLSSRAAGRDHAAGLLAWSPARRPTAIFAPQTLLSEGAITAIYQAGFRVPDDISLIGYTASINPDITSVVAPIAEVGREAAARLIARLSGSEPGAEPCQTILPVTLCDKGTTGPPKKPQSKTRRRRTE